MTDFSRMLGEYPDFLRWKHLVRLFGMSRRSLERWRMEGKLDGIEFVDITNDGHLMATRQSVVAFLEKRVMETQKRYERPPLSVMGTVR